MRMGATGNLHVRPPFKDLASNDLVANRGENARLAIRLGVAGIAGQAVAGCAIVFGGKLAVPYLLFGLQADQSWACVAAICGWWAVGLFVTGFSARRIAGIAMAAGQACAAMRDHTAAMPAEPVRAALAASPEPAQDLAQTSDHQVRTMAAAAAETARQARSRTATLAAAASTEQVADDAAALAQAVSIDATAMTQVAVQLQASLDETRKRGNAAAANVKRVSDQASRSNLAMTEFDTAADQVGQAVALIAGIAARTKLLALNAMIEAARAGEAGRGFAVVADEVKLLAHQTTVTTSEVKQLVASMRHASNGVTAALLSITDNIGQMVATSSHVRLTVTDQAAMVVGIARDANILQGNASRMSVQALAAAGSAQATNAAAQDMQRATDLLAGDAESLHCEAGALIVNAQAA